MPFFKMIAVLASSAALCACAAAVSAPRPSVPEQPAAPPDEPRPVYGEDYVLAYEFPSEGWTRVFDDVRTDGIVYCFRHEPTGSMVYVDVTAYDEVTPEYAADDIFERWNAEPSARTEETVPFIENGRRGAVVSGTFEPTPGLLVAREFIYHQLSERYECSVMTIALWRADLGPAFRPEYERLLGSFRAVPVESAPSVE